MEWLCDESFESQEYATPSVPMSHIHPVRTFREATTEKLLMVSSTEYFWPDTRLGLNVGLCSYALLKPLVTYHAGHFVK